MYNIILKKDSIRFTSRSFNRWVKCLCFCKLADLSLRLLYHHRSSFNVENLLFYYCNEIKERLKAVEGYRMGKLKRKKVKVPREYSFEHSVGIFQIFLAKKSILEFEFAGEEGSGLGPTLEFYSLVAEQIMNPDLNLWRKTPDNSLFPSAFIKEDIFERTRIIFRMIGCFIGRVLIDKRTIDFPLNPIIWKLCQRKVIFPFYSAFQP